MKLYKFMLVLFLLVGEFVVFTSFNKKNKPLDVSAGVQEEVVNRPLEISG